MGRKRGKRLLLLCSILTVWLLAGHTAEAKALGSGDKTIAKGKEAAVEVKLDGPGVIVLNAEINISGAGIKSSNDKLRFKLKDASGQVISNDLYQFGDGYADSTWTGTFSSEKVLPAGNYTYVLENSGTHALRVRYDLKCYPETAGSISIPAVLAVKTGEIKEIAMQKTPANSFAVIKDVRLSNEDAVHIYYENETLSIYAVKAGKCTLTVILDNQSSYTCTITVTDPAPKIAYKEVTLFKGENLKNQVSFTTQKAKWTSSNKKVATVDKNGKIKARNIGKCTITGKIGSKVYKCKVKVVVQPPNFYADLQKDNAKGSCFKVKIKNYSNKPLTILSKDAVSIHNKSRSNDRYLRLKNDKDVKIAPGKTKTVKFYVVGKKTVSNAKAHTIIYHFKFDGKKYAGGMTTKGSDYRNKKKWYNTYWVGYR